MFYNFCKAYGQKVPKKFIFTFIMGLNIEWVIAVGIFNFSNTFNLIALNGTIKLRLSKPR